MNSIKKKVRNVRLWYQPELKAHLHFRLDRYRCRRADPHDYHYCHREAKVSGQLVQQRVGLGGWSGCRGLTSTNYSPAEIKDVPTFEGLFQFMTSRSLLKPSQLKMAISIKIVGKNVFSQGSILLCNDEVWRRR